MVFKGDMPEVKSGEEKGERIPKDDMLVVKPGEKKEGTGTEPVPASKPVVVKREAKPVSVREPLVIKPDGNAKPAMPELKGVPDKKLERKKPEKAPREPGSRPLTVMLFISMVLLAAGTALLVLSILDVPFSDGAEPVINFCRKLPLFPE